MKRKRKIEPKKILENLLSLRLESSSLRLDDLALELKKQECEISKPALHKKLNATAVNFLVLVLQGLLKHVFAASKAHL